MAEFGIHTKMFLVDNRCKTCRKWAINNFIKCSNNNFITLLIMNIGAESAIHIKEFCTTCHCQVDKLDYLDIGSINHVSKDVVLS